MRKTLLKIGKIALIFFSYEAHKPSMEMYENYESNLYACKIEHFRCEVCVLIKYHAGVHICTQPKHAYELYILNITESA